MTRLNTKPKGSSAFIAVFFMTAPVYPLAVSGSLFGISRHGHPTRFPFRGASCGIRDHRRKQCVSYFICNSQNIGDQETAFSCLAARFTDNPKRWRLRINYRRLCLQRDHCSNRRNCDNTVPKFLRRAQSDKRPPLQVPAHRHREVNRISQTGVLRRKWWQSEISDIPVDVLIDNVQPLSIPCARLAR